MRMTDGQIRGDGGEDVNLLDDLAAFVQEHKRYGLLDSEVTSAA